MRTLLDKLLRNRDGATAIEYGLIAALVALAIVAGATTLGKNLSSEFTNIAGQVNPGAGGG
ncbi:MAG TPA: Flp family type IVb pilin [Stellaceae bacterium]|nr:Flp family type IVb pilin [Stellaceae bacterium]